MLDPLGRLAVVSGSIPAYGPTTWSFLDYDTRRWIQFEGPTDPFGLDDDDYNAGKAAEVLVAVIDDLDQNVTKVTFSADGQFLRSSTDPEDSLARFVKYPLIKESMIGDSVHRLLVKDQWTEQDRLGPGVDLIKVFTSDMLEELVVFKYVLVDTRVVMRRLWTSAFFHQALSEHPNIVPFKHFVIHAGSDNSVDKAESHFVGYTTEFIPGGSLDVRPLETFKVDWLHQLMNLVDDLNLKYGVVHLDIAPRNLLLQQDQMLLFDFEAAGFLGSKEPWIREYGDVIDLAFAVYEILTGDGQFGPEQQRGRKLELIMEIPEWRLKEGIRLEHGITTHDIKRQLYDWARLRMKATYDIKTRLYDWARLIMSATLTKKFELRHKINCPDMLTERVLVEIENLPGQMEPAFYVADVPPGTRVVDWKRRPGTHISDSMVRNERIKDR